ncbi:MAG: hypothetical protein V4658_05375 [Bacteroidota bacterium]
MVLSDILKDLKLQSDGHPLVINNAIEAGRLNVPVAEYVKAIRELNLSGALNILIEPMGSFCITVNMLAD